MKTIKLLGFSVIAGVAVTLVTGLINTTPSGLLGASWYGWPASWLRKLVLAPQYNPWKLDKTALLIDLVVWFVVALIILYITTSMKSKGKSKK
jgi:hypothetical protein